MMMTTTKEKYSQVRDEARDAVLRSHGEGGKSDGGSPSSFLSACVLVNNPNPHVIDSGGGSNTKRGDKKKKKKTTARTTTTTTTTTTTDVLQQIPFSSDNIITTTISGVDNRSNCSEPQNFLSDARAHAVHDLIANSRSQSKKSSNLVNDGVAGLVVDSVVTLDNVSTTAKNVDEILINEVNQLVNDRVANDADLNPSTAVVEDNPVAEDKDDADSYGERKRHLIGDEFYTKLSSTGSVDDVNANKYGVIGGNSNTASRFIIYSTAAPDVISAPATTDSQITSNNTQQSLLLQQSQQQDLGGPAGDQQMKKRGVSCLTGLLRTPKLRASNLTFSENDGSGVESGGAYLHSGMVAASTSPMHHSHSPSHIDISDFQTAPNAGHSIAAATSDHQPIDMASILGQHVKNEPEDLTGCRRDSNTDATNVVSNISGVTHTLIKTTLSDVTLLGPPGGKGSPVLVSTPEGQVVFSSTDLNNTVPFPPPPVTSAVSGAPPEEPNFPPGNHEFSPFTDDGRPIYPSDPYRHDDHQIYTSSTGHGHHSPDFGPPCTQAPSDVSRSGGSSDALYMYHYKTGGAPGIPPASGTSLPGSLQLGPPGTPHLNSPDSSIGDGPTGQPHDGFDNYPHIDILNDVSRKQPWQDYRQNEEKIHIPKVFSPYGFKYTFEAQTSSSQRREDDKITYVNKGQFYNITLEYHVDPEGPPLKSGTVKSIIMMVFREGKTSEEELKAWQFWHSRQHSVKQRILDADTKNSLGLVGCIEEIAHNALAVYWNPLESPAKVSLAVQCLSTDFSTQKGVKGLPLHLQIDTYDDPRDTNCPVYHRGYCQIKIFCDKGAERKARDEERRAAKRRMTTTGKRRIDEMYHIPTERSEFYSMANLDKPPVFFVPTTDPEKAAMEFGTELPSFYSQTRNSLTPPDPLLKLNGNAGDTEPPLNPVQVPPSPLLQPSLPIFEAKPHLTTFEYKTVVPGCGGVTVLQPPTKRMKTFPPETERIMIYVRQETEEAHTPLHLVPPTVPGLIRAIESKYKINASNIRYLYRKTKTGIIAKIDDDMLRFYCNEDVFLMQVMVTEGIGGEDSMVYDITLSEA